MACVGSEWVRGRGVCPTVGCAAQLASWGVGDKAAWVVVVVVVVRGLKLVGGGLGWIEDMVVAHSKVVVWSGLPSLFYSPRRRRDATQRNATQRRSGRSSGRQGRQTEQFIMLAAPFCEGRVAVSGRGVWRLHMHNVLRRQRSAGGGAANGRRGAEDEQVGRLLWLAAPSCSTACSMAEAEATAGARGRERRASRATVAPQRQAGRGAGAVLVCRLAGDRACGREAYARRTQGPRGRQHTDTRPGPREVPSRSSGQGT